MEEEVTKTSRGLPRFRRVDNMKPVETHPVCGQCKGLCCSLPQINTTLTVREMSLFRGQKLPFLTMMYHKKWEKTRRRLTRTTDPDHFESFIDDRPGREGTIEDWIPAYRSTRGIPFVRTTRFGSCVYFNQRNKRCAIYSRRPDACRRWFCNQPEGGAWQGLLDYAKHKQQPPEPAEARFMSSRISSRLSLDRALEAKHVCLGRSG